MKRIALILVGLSMVLTASEIEYGRGSFSMKGGFLGLTRTSSTDIDSFSLVERHSNVGDFFYGYDFIWYDSDVMKQGQYTYNSSAEINELLPDKSPLKVPAMEHRFKGLDANIRVGYDVIHKNEDNFLGLGLLLGISLPVIDSVSPQNSIESNLEKGTFDAVNDNEVMVKSKTKVKTYKIGATLAFQKSLNEKIAIYGLGSYAYQTGEIKNSYADAKYPVDGIFQEYNLGLYFTPFTETYKWGWLTLSPRLYATIGYKYAHWDVEEMAINLSGYELSSDVLDSFAMDFSMDTSIGYFGIGYSF